ncbi:hypothetical protein L202_08287 [Cryptococcus amylolentus CBS 6039]|uniref:Oxidase FUB9 n=1 Tax=Cryptococcus amylolentus CBS 6039 TaxID=1295533 RepID=A0A1E3H940_9TREE|nr:hypothetical protein L202_08287 [Cryptococcus amylolentus CBS 6039]ODN72859.1 hypothetical protein L202_08287 [Cryptococcus amylolentus CBS 6039]
MDPKPISIADLERIALAKLPKSTRDYYASGAEEEITLRENITSLQRYRIVPRYLVDVGLDKLDSRSRPVWGKRQNVPFAVGPSAFHRLAGFDGELDVARAASKRGISMGLSSSSTSSLEDVIHAGTAVNDWWYQLYVSSERQDTEALVKRAEKAGYTALLITVDRPYLGRRHTHLREKFELPPHLRRDTGAKMAQDPSMHWDELIPWLRSITSLKLLVKGILHPEDALLALLHGLDGIVVSNHGGRQLDAAPATIDALPSIADVVQGRIPIFFDGGVRKGLDVFRALALGADIVLLGRAVLWGLAANGEPGVGLALDIITEEFKLVMALAGVTDISQIKRSALALVNPSQIGLVRVEDAEWEDRRAW